MSAQSFYKIKKCDFILVKKEIVGEQRKVNKCRTKSGKKIIYCSLYCYINTFIENK